MRKGNIYFIALFIVSFLLFGCNSNKNSQEEILDSTTYDEYKSFFSSDFTPERILKIPYATSSDGYVNIRTSPSNDGEILGKITSFGSGVILGTEIDYYKVNDGEVTGYCYSKYIDYYTWYDGTGNKRIVTTKDCPLYSGYSEGDAKPLAIIPIGTIIGDKFYDENTDDFYFIIDEGDSYILNTPFDNEWKIKKSYVTAEKCKPTATKKTKVKKENNLNYSESYNGNNNNSYNKQSYNTDWIPGLWRYKGYVNGSYLSTELRIDGMYNLITIWFDGQKIGQGTWEVRGDKLYFGDGYLAIDMQNHYIYVDKKNGPRYSRICDI